MLQIRLAQVSLSFIPRCAELHLRRAEAGIETEIFGRPIIGAVRQQRMIPPRWSSAPGPRWMTA
jgi:hypothetical protein